MSDLVKIAVDAMGGDDSQKKLLMVLFISTRKMRKFFIKFLEIKMKLEN